MKKACAVIVVAVLASALSRPLPAQFRAGCGSAASSAISVDQGHPWRAPFGPERVGSLPVVHVMMPAEQEPRGVELVSYRNKQELERHPLTFRRSPSRHDGGIHVPRVVTPFYAQASLRSIPSEIALQADCDGRQKEVARKTVSWPEIEADAIARPDRLINPVDLGTILPPHDWLLLGDGQTAVIEVAALAQSQDVPHAKVRAWFDGGKPTELAMALTRQQRATRELQVALPAAGERTTLHVSLTDGRREFWRKEIQTMVVPKPPPWPTFGAVETKLRYDASISVQDRKAKKSATLDYDQGWDPALKDIVVFLPNGSRFVFWRGSSYVPFWAGLHNTGFSYQWAETIPPPGYIDAVEPLQDKKLRYGRVRIVASTVSRVHVRWSYQSVDAEYRSLGDEAVEDFYFYPDGFGTRVATLASARPQDYMFSEFIVVLPQAALPFDVLPRPVVDLLFMNGQKRQIALPLQRGSYAPMDIPFPQEKQGTDYHPVERVFAQILRYQQEQGKEISATQIESMSRVLAKISYPRHPVIYRIAAHKDDAATPIYFSAHASASVLASRPFDDGGEPVTPAYWGDHWPLGRGALTGGAISDRIYSSPSHLFLMDLTEPEPLSAGTRNMPDAHGDVRQMTLLSRVWLIGKTDLPDTELLKWSQSFSSPPSVKLVGARLDLPSYSAERRAIRLIAEAPSIQVDLTPSEYMINPVFELDQVRELLGVTVDGRTLAEGDYTWDGAILWIRAASDPRGMRISLSLRPSRSDL